jgi:Tol biopolymer transport system component
MAVRMDHVVPGAVMAGLSRFGSVLSVLPLASLVATAVPALPAVPVLTGAAGIAGPAGAGDPAGRAGAVLRSAGQAAYPSRTSSISGRGDVVTFTENFRPPGGYSPVNVVFARDVSMGVTRRISRGALLAGARRVPGNGVHPDSAVSADGRWVAFAEWVDVPRFDVLVYDLATGTSRRVNVGSGAAAPNGSSVDPAISADGSYVAFESTATNLVAGDTNNATDIFRTDGSTVRRVSVARTRQADGSSYGAAISGDGRYVAFSSDATNLVARDTNNVPDVFVRDLRYGTTNRLSVATDRRQADGPSLRLGMSADGRYVAFESAATNLVPGDTNLATDVFIRDLRDGTTNRVSLASDGTQGNDYSAGPALSADGRYLAFTSAATNLVAGDTNQCADVFVRDLHSGATYRVSLTADGSEANGFATAASISADGRFVSFTSGASNLVPDDTNGVEDGFRYDRWSHTITRTTVDVDPY